MKQEKEFDRSHCFTFYKDFHEQIMDVKRDFGLEQAFEVYEAIANYGLYGTEIKKGKLRTLVGNATITKVESSQENRAKWFKGENFEQTKLVAEYMRDHPKASQRTIAEATGVGKTKVGKVQKNIRESDFENIQDYLENIVYPHINLNDSNNDNDSNSNNNIVTEGETDHRDQSVLPDSHIESATPPQESSTPTTQTEQTELTWEEYNSVIDMWEVNKTKSKEDRKKPNEIADELKLDRGLVNKAIDEFKKNGFSRKKKTKSEHNRIIGRDNLPTSYYTDDFTINKDNVSDKYKEFTNPFGYYKFQIEFVDKWFLKEFGYVHKKAV